MDKQQIKDMVCKAIDENKQALYDFGDSVFANPEFGYKEYKTSQKVKDFFDSLGIKYQDNLAVTGIKAKLKDNAEGINVAVMGELDAVMCPLHPFADQETGAAHCCGHFAQLTTMLAVACGFAKTNALDYLGGNVSFIAAPAEECIEIEYRKELMNKGVLKYPGGKQNLIALGAFDDVDMAMMVHGSSDCKNGEVIAYAQSVGFVAKSVKFIGKEAHAGFAPWDGANALNAASLALQAINNMRETFKDSDSIRIHPVITKGGTMVNVVPDDVRMEMYIRGASIEAIKDANLKVNKALTGCAYAQGVQVEIEDMTGYLPLKPDKELANVFGENAAQLFPDRKIIYTDNIDGASTDAGDVSSIIPTVHAGMGGFGGNFHSKFFTLDDKEKAYIEPAKVMACSIIDLLYNDGEKAKEIKSHFTANQNYRQLWDDILKFDKPNF